MINPFKDITDVVKIVLNKYRAWAECRLIKCLCYTLLPPPFLKSSNDVLSLYEAHFAAEMLFM